MVNVLLVQASSVPCERIFLASKDTDTAKRNLLALRMMEMLQILKYSLKSSQLDFTAGICVCEEDCESLELDSSLLDDLMSDCTRVNEFAEVLGSRGIFDNRENFPDIGDTANPLDILF